jgi:hypothetical protein
MPQKKRSQRLLPLIIECAVTNHMRETFTRLTTQPYLPHDKFFFFFNRHYNPGWVSACSTVVGHSQQEGFTECRCQRHIKPPTWRRTSDLERSNFRHKRSPASEAMLANPTAEGGTMGEKWPRILPKVTTSSLLGSFTCRKARHGTDGFISPPKEGVLRIFSPEKSDGFSRV